MREYLLDVTRLVWRAWRGGLPTGIDRVCLAYVEHFASRSQAVVQRGGRYFLLSPSNSDRLFELLLDFRVSRLALLRLAAAAWLSTIRRAPRQGAIYLNVGHTGLNEPSLPGWISENSLRAVYMVHDLIPVTHPQYCRAGEDAKHGQRIENMLASATGIIANSQATLAELTRFAHQYDYAMPPHIVAAIAGHQALRSKPPARLDRPYFLVTGTIEARKNHLLLLQVWRQLVGELGDEAPILVIVGQRGWEAEPVLAALDNPAELKGHVIENGNCSDDELASLIAGAHAVLMPSFVEGFGLPVVEALQLSTPVIASDLPVYREIASDIPTFLDPDDQAGWALAIKDFVNDGPERRRQLTDMASFSAPSWAVHFDQVERWLTRMD